MRKMLLLSVLTSLSSISNAQNSTPRNIGIEKSLTGVQIGFLGIELYNEAKLSEKIVLRSEVGLYFGGIWAGDIYEKTGFILYPGLSLQPKYYYNIGRRIKKGKNIKNNSANFFSLQVKYTPDWFVISNYSDVTGTNHIGFIPTFGFRRNFARNFNYEFKVGYGYGFTLGESQNVSGVSADLGFKIGYDF